MSFKSKKPAKNTQKSKEFILTIDLVPSTNVTFIALQAFAKGELERI